MDKYESRRQRLRQLIDERCAGVSSSFAKQIGRDASYVTRMLYPEGKAGRKRIADDMMEIIEAAFDLAILSIEQRIQHSGGVPIGQGRRALVHTSQPQI